MDHHNHQKHSYGSSTSTRPSTTSTMSSGGGGNVGAIAFGRDEPPYQLENAVSEIFEMFQVREGKHFSREIASESLAKKIGHQSKKPFSLFYERLASNEEFVHKYDSIKCQNINEVDPFVRLLVRMRENKEMLQMLNAYSSMNGEHSATAMQHPSSTPGTAIRQQLVDNLNHHSSSSPPPPSTTVYNHNNHRYRSKSKPTYSSNRHSSADTPGWTGDTNAVLSNIGRPDRGNVRGYSPPPILLDNGGNLTLGGNASFESYTSSMPHETSLMQESPMAMKKAHGMAVTKSPDSFINASDVSANELDGSFQSRHSGGKNKNSRNKVVHQHKSSGTSTKNGFTSSGTKVVPRSSTSSTTSSAHHRGGSSSSGGRKVPPHLSRDFHPLDWPKENDTFGQLGTLSVEQQECALLRDLLYVLNGIEGQYIRMQPSEDSNRYKLCIDPTADHHLVASTERILKLAYCYSSIITYVESKVYGLVNQALVATIQKHLFEFATKITMMEEWLMRDDLFLQKMYYELLPFFKTFPLLRDMAQRLYKNKCVGGSVLTILHEKTKSIQGIDNNAQALCQQLTKDASLPYFEILSTWIYYGEIVDPRKEFFIEDTQQAVSSSSGVTSNGSNHYQDSPEQHLQHRNNRQHINGGSSGGGGGHDSDELISSDDEYDDDFGKFNDKYWDQRYRINSAKTPIFLKKHEQIIYKTGKYVSIIKKVKQLFMRHSKMMPTSSMPAVAGSNNFGTIGGSTLSGFGAAGAGVIALNTNEAAKYSTFNDLLRGISNEQSAYNNAMFGGSGGTMPSQLSLGYQPQPTSFMDSVSLVGGGAYSGPMSGFFNAGGPPSTLQSLHAYHQQQQHHHNLLSSHPHLLPSSASSTASSGASSTNSGGNGGGGGGKPTPPINTGLAIYTPNPQDISYDIVDSVYLSPIMSAYEQASSQLLHILINESQLVETFNAVKHYMLMSMGDFVVHFLKFSSAEMCKRTDSVVQHRLDSMMGMALGISVAASDRTFLKDDPHVEFAGKTFLKQTYKLMKPLDTTDGSLGRWNSNDPSHSSLSMLKSNYGNDFDDDDDDDDMADGDEVELNRSIISSVIEGKTTSDGDRWLAVSGQTSGFATTAPLGSVPGMSISSQVRLRKLYANSGKVPKYDMLDTSSSLLATANQPRVSQQQQQPSSTTTVTTAQQKPPQLPLYCYESLMLKFDVPFPLSLIFTQKSIICYQLLFRYIFLCRYAEYELEETWKDNILNVQLKQCDVVARNALYASSSNLHNTESDNAEQARLLVKAFKSIHKKAFALRYKMIAFVRNFHYFLSCEVVDPAFAGFIAQITKRGSSLDSVIECHEKFLETCFSQCFVTSIEITTIIVKVIQLCIELSHALKDSIDKDDHSSMMKSSVFFGRANNPYSSSSSKSRDSPDLASLDQNQQQSSSSSRLSPFESQLHEKLNKIYFSNRNFGQSVRTVKDIVERANHEFDSLVTLLLKKVYSDNCEYHMLYPFVARLDFNDFYRSKIVE